MFFYLVDRYPQTSDQVSNSIQSGGDWCGECEIWEGGMRGEGGGLGYGMVASEGGRQW